MRVRRASVQVCALVPTALQRHWFYLVYLRSTVCHPTRGYEYNDSGSNSSTTGSAWNDSAGGGSGRRREERKEEAEKVKDRLPNYEAEADEKTDRRIRPLQLAADVDSDGAVVRYVYAVVTGAPALRPCHARSPCSFGVTGWLVAVCCVAGRPLGR
ncbi:hypothetical protein CCUS01_07984 [Colletotrichum cuscutae]|uniref:Uncharacterized protein n=1 Tax=Colletotrichum cuscutae TaxID=1209917 RepID=A0AAI9UTE3_9PEZI|nr:hypothetical protein CCUS01_07984 [Colletotrichum cuscutae]